MIGFQGLPAVSASAMRELDRRASVEFGIAPAALMENAGRAIAREVMKTPAFSPGISVVVCCGRGNNGGDGLVAARFLKEHGAAPLVFMLEPKQGAACGALVSLNLARAKASGAPVAIIGKDTGPLAAALRKCGVVVDALLGTGASGRPVGTLEKIILLINACGKPVAAVDVPSGLDPDTGLCEGACVRAKWTCALGLAKTGLLNKEAGQYVGELQVLDIGYPAELLIDPVQSSTVQRSGLQNDKN